MSYTKWGNQPLYGSTKVAPCKECKERTLNCHDSCKKFKKWQKYIQEAKNQYRKETIDDRWRK